MKLDDICLLIADCPHSTAPDEGAGFPLIRTPNIGFGRFNIDGVHRVSEKVYNIGTLAPYRKITTSFLLAKHQQVMLQ